MEDLSQFEPALQERSKGQCELCQSKDALEIIVTSPKKASSDSCVCVCVDCKGQIVGLQELDSKHWFCLKESIWSEVPAVQVQAYRLLKRLEAQAWAQDLLTQVYLSDDVQEWVDSDSEDGVITLDSNGTVLSEGDSVTIIKDLDVKGAGFVAKRGTMVRNIHLIDEPDNIEGRVNKTTLVLKTQFLKKA